mmetsp:Transcript_6666/g.27949  ORF Transcript_6666/g.27949 Transcript_6666/m.27949 type:complete len:593 (-) Transcript_6666:174-1952(-)
MMHACRGWAAVVLLRDTAAALEGVAYPGAADLADIPTYAFPEAATLGARNATVVLNAGAAFSGGGSRAFACALGQIAALRARGVWERLRYATGTSGGTWALASYAYRNSSAEAYLCSIHEPSNLTPSALATIAPGCGLALAAGFRFSDYASVAGGAWVDAIHATFLEPVGVERSALLGYTPAAEQGSLRAEDPRGTAYVRDPVGDPYPLFGFSFWGPSASTPVGRGDSESTALRVFEAAPFAVGTPLQSNVTFAPTRKRRQQTTVPVGGYVSPGVWGCDGLGYIDDEGASAVSTRAALLRRVVRVETNATTCAGATVALAAGASSFYSGGTFATLLGSKANTKLGLLSSSYFSAGTSTRDVLLADGGNVENVLLSSLLQRNATRLLLFFNAEVPLNLTWDPSVRNATTEDLNDDFAAFFADALPSDAADDPTYDYAADAVFPAEDFAPLVAALQTSARSGLGAVATASHVTIANHALGVPSGLRVTVTWVYLADSAAWRAALPRATRALLDADPAFDAFPHFATLDAALSHRQLTALASLTAFVVAANYDAHFADVLGVAGAESPQSSPASSSSSSSGTAAAAPPPQRESPP